MRVVYLRGVLDDGDRPQVGFPPDARAPLSLPHRSAAEVVVRLFNPAGVPVAMEADDELELVVVSRSQCEPLPSLTLTADPAPMRGLNVAVFDVDAAHTDLMTPGQYQYNVWHVRGSTRSLVIPTSQLILERTFNPA